MIDPESQESARTLEIPSAMVPPQKDDECRMTAPPSPQAEEAEAGMYLPPPWKSCDRCGGAIVGKALEPFRAVCAHCGGGIIDKVCDLPNTDSGTHVAKSHAERILKQFQIRFAPSEELVMEPATDVPSRDVDLVDAICGCCGGFLVRCTRCNELKTGPLNDDDQHVCRTCDLDVVQKTCRTCGKLFSIRFPGVRCRSCGRQRKKIHRAGIAPR